MVSSPSAMQTVATRPGRNGARATNPKVQMRTETRPVPKIQESASSSAILRRVAGGKSRRKTHPAPRMVATHPRSPRKFTFFPDSERSRINRRPIPLAARVAAVEHDKKQLPQSSLAQLNEESRHFVDRQSAPDAAKPDMRPAYQETRSVDRHRAQRSEFHLKTAESQRTR